MKHLHHTWNDSDESSADAGELVDRTSHVEPSDVRASGVFARDDRAAPDACAAPAERAGPTVPVRPCRDFAELYARHHEMVWARIQRRWLREPDAEDVFQSVFVDMKEWVDEHEMPPDPIPLLVTMIGHELCNQLRALIRRDRRFGAAIDPDEVPSSTRDPEQHTYLRERADEGLRKLEAVLAKMPPDAADVLRLCDIEEVPLADVAFVLDRPLGNVKVQLHRARARFVEVATRLYKVNAGGSK